MFAPTREAIDPLVDDPADLARRAPLMAVAVDTLKQGLIVFDATGHVAGANAAARRAIDARAELTLAPSPVPPHERLQLRVRRSATQLQLERALRECTMAGRRALAPGAASVRDTRAAKALVLTLEHGQPGLILQLAPMAVDSQRSGPEPTVLGVLIDRSHAPTLDPSTLRELFGLTEAEARVAEAYLHADTVKDVAALLGVSANTVKTHLAAAYLKTGCTRQAQLVRLLMSLSDLGDGPAFSTH